MKVFVNAAVVITLQYINVSNQDIVHLKLKHNVMHHLHLKKDGKKEFEPNIFFHPLQPFLRMV